MRGVLSALIGLTLLLPRAAADSLTTPPLVGSSRPATPASNPAAGLAQGHVSSPAPPDTAKAGPLVKKKKSVNPILAWFAGLLHAGSPGAGSKPTTAAVPVVERASPPKPEKAPPATPKQNAEKPSKPAAANTGAGGEFPRKLKALFAPQNNKTTVQHAKSAPPPAGLIQRLAGNGKTTAEAGKQTAAQSASPTLQTAAPVTRAAVRQPAAAQIKTPTISAPETAPMRAKLTALMFPHQDGLQAGSEKLKSPQTAFGTERQPAGLDLHNVLTLPLPVKTPSALPLGEGTSIPELTAAKIKEEEAGARARRAAVRYLGTVDPHYFPEAEEALLAALRCDRNESVRLEAAQALGNGRFRSRRVVQGLHLAVSGSCADSNPAETSNRVKTAAAASLQICLAKAKGPMPSQPVQSTAPRPYAGDPKSAKPILQPVQHAPLSIEERRKTNEAITAALRTLAETVSVPPAQTPARRTEPPGLLQRIAGSSEAHGDPQQNSQREPGTGVLGLRPIGRIPGQP